ncbi:MAG: hypothetical protein N3E50_07715 [Candidatus Goldbacteria bacterium]|nr:hypothetical protein [Candidatus Goldiibacteriota bacterium]
MIKKIFLLFFSLFFFISLIFISCSKSGDNPTGPGSPVNTNTWTPNWTATITKTNTFSPTITFTYITYIPTLTPTWVNGADFYEPDNIYSQAKTITSGQTQMHSIHVWDDEDWMKFTVNNSFVFSIYTWGSNNPLTYIEVYKNDPTGPTYCTGGDGNSPGEIVDYQFNDPGTYYIKIRPWDYNPISLYYIQLLVYVYPTPTSTYTISPTKTMTHIDTEETQTTYTPTLTPTPWPTDIYEPDNNPTQARGLTPGIEYGHSLHSSDDEDWFYFNINSPSRVTIKAGEDNTGYMKNMAIYNEYLSAIVYTGGNPYAIDSREYWTPGKYYVKIHPWAGMPAEYNIEFSMSLFTPTNTPFVAFTPTVTVTYHMDPYEPDDTYLEAKEISNGATQIRSIVPRANDDFIKYISPGNEVITSYCFGDTNSYYKVDYLIATPDIYGYTREESTSDMEIVILEQFTPGPVYIRVQGDQLFSYSFSLIAHSMTPTFTFTATPTITPTFTITKTYTITQTNTITNTFTQTFTPTPTWQIIAIFGSGNILEPKIYSDGSNYSYGYIYNTSNLYVNANLVSVSVNSSKMGGKWLFKNTSNSYVAFTDNSNNIFVRKDTDWQANIGNSSIATGYFPNIYVNFNTPYVAYISSNNKVSVKYFNGTNWQNYGNSDFSTTVNHNIGFGNPLVMDGYNDGNLKLYVAYINNTDNKLYCYYHNGITWAPLGITPVSDAEVSDIDISVIDGSNIYITYLYYNSPQKIFVKKFNGTSWVDIGNNPIVDTTTNIYNNKNLSIYAAANNNVWLAYKSQYSYYYITEVLHWNGVNWINKGSPDKLTGSSDPTITLVNNIPYVSFTNTTQMKISKLE